MEKSEVPQENIDRAYYNAVADGNADAARHWLERGADVNHRPYDEEWLEGLMPPPLIWAVINRSPEVAQVLIDYDVDVNATDSDGESMLIAALDAYAPEIALLLVEAGADLTCTDARARPPLEIANEESGLFQYVIAAIRGRS